MGESEITKIKEIVLVIEDNDGDFLLIEDHLLERFNLIRVVQCRTLLEAQNFLDINKSEISAILLDLNLPDASGIELSGKIIEAANQVPIIILSGYADLPTAQQSLKLGISDYLVKDDLTPDFLHKAIVYAKERNYHINLLQKSKTMYQDLFDLSPQPMWIYNPSNLAFLNVNKAACTKYGYSLEEFKKMTLKDIRPKEGLVPLYRSLNNRKSNTGTSFAGTFVHRLRSEKDIHVEIFSSDVDFQDIKARLVLVHDVTENLEYINTIEIQNKKLRDIAWTQSHLVRAPLARIMGIIELIAGPENDKDELTFWLSQLKTSSLELDDVIRKIVGNTDIIHSEKKK